MQTTPDGDQEPIFSGYSSHFMLHSSGYNNGEMNWDVYGWVD
jgi:hypothetical protein